MLLDPTLTYPDFVADLGPAYARPAYDRYCEACDRLFEQSPAAYMQALFAARIEPQRLAA